MTWDLPVEVAAVVEEVLVAGSWVVEEEAEAVSVEIEVRVTGVAPEVNLEANTKTLFLFLQANVASSSAKAERRSRTSIRFEFKHFLVKSFLGNGYRHLVTFYWSHFLEVNND